MKKLGLSTIAIFFVFSIFLPGVALAANLSDTFTGTGNTLLQNHTSDSGNAWSKQTGTLDGVISNANRLRFDITNGTTIYVSDWIPATADYDVSADFYIAGTSADFTGIGGRNSPSSPTGYYAVLGAGNVIRLYRGGNGTPLGSQTVTANTGETHTMKLEMRGNVIKVYWDASVIINATAAGGDIVSTAGRASVYLQATAGDSAGIHLDNFFAADANLLNAGTLSRITSSATTETLAWTSATGGTNPVSAQLQRSPVGAGTWSNVSGATTSPATDTGLSPSTSYDYRVVFTDAASTTVYSNTLSVTTNSNVPVGAYGSIVESEGTLLHYWPMTDGTGVTTLVSAVGGVPISLTGATANSGGQVDGGAVSFNGTSNFGVTSSNINLSLYNKIVVEAVFKYTLNSGGVGWESPADINSSDSGYLYLPVEPSVTASANVILKGNTGYNYAFYNRDTADTWHHIVAVYDKSAPSSEVEYYVDGILQSATSTPDTSNNTNNFGNDPLYIMSRGGSSLFMPGSMQHLAIYTDLDDSRILAHYEAAFPASLTAGIISEITSSATTETLAWTSATGGTNPVSAQLQRSPVGAGTWSNVSGATTSPATDTGLSPSTSYDYRVVFTDAASTTVYSNTLSVTTTIATTTYTVQVDDLWNNNYNNVSQPKQSPFSRFLFTTNAGSITINANTTLYSTYPLYAHMGVKVNGVELMPLVFTADGNKSFPISLGTAGTTRTIEIIDGTQSTGGGSTSLGNYLTSITYPDTATFSILAPVNSNSVLFYGDSISAGGNSINPEYEAYVPLLRSTYGFNTILEGWGYRALYDDASNGTKINNFVNHVASTSPSVVWLAIGTNDYGLTKWNASNFGTALASVIDGLHTALPSARIICQTPLTRTNESANGLGSTLGDYRTQITNVCNARSSYATTIDGSNFLSLGDLDDGLHPTSAGFIKYANRIAPILNQPTFTVSGPASGLVSQASTSFTVSLAGSVTFMGDQSITISDSGNGGVFTSSLGSGTGSVTVTPSNTMTDFTFTYTPASTGLKTFTFTNAQNWNNPSTTDYNVGSPTKTLTYSAGVHGSIIGDSSQSVNVGSDGATVTAVADTGYHFVNWSDSSVQNPRTDTNVTSNLSVTANFAINTYSVAYSAGAHGSVTGSLSQTVNHGSNATAVTAVPDSGYSFVSWSDASVSNPRTDTNITSNLSISANFDPNTYSLNYAAGAHGSISGTSPQTISYGDDGTSVTAVADTGFHFVSWSDSSTQNPRTDMNVSGNLSVTASFAINMYTVNYAAGSHGSVTGTASQTVNYGAATTAVTAVADPGYAFDKWSDNSTQNPRTDTSVIANLNVTAMFISTSAPSHSSGSHSSGGGFNYGCKDPSATNYDAFSVNNPALCVYAVKSPVATAPGTLGTPGVCSISQILTQNLKAPSRNGVYNSYTKGIVMEAKKLQTHLNRLGFASGKEDGILGPISDGAIKRMQTFLGTKADGFVGPLTRALINNSCGE